MKRLPMLLILLLLTATIALPSLSAKPSDYCSTAKDACSELQFEVFMNCVNNGGGYQECKCRDLRAYNACMAQWGCPGKSEQFMLEEGCGPD